MQTSKNCHSQIMSDDCTEHPWFTSQGRPNVWIQTTRTCLDGDMSQCSCKTLNVHTIDKSNVEPTIELLNMLSKCGMPSFATHLNLALGPSHDPLLIDALCDFIVAHGRIEVFGLHRHSDTKINKDVLRKIALAFLISDITMFVDSTCWPWKSKRRPIIKNIHILNMLRCMPVHCYNPLSKIPVELLKSVLTPLLIHFD